MNKKNIKRKTNKELSKAIKKTYKDKNEQHQELDKAKNSLKKN
jgi:hypothetical protein